MHQNLHAYRNLGVRCMVAQCGFCSRIAAHSVYFELDRERRRVCSLGCTACGRARRLSETQYEALYEASFEFDSWQSGEIDFETFRDSLPEAFRSVVQECEKETAEAEWTCRKCGESVPESLPECWNCGYDAEGRLVQKSHAEPETETAVPVMETGVSDGGRKTIRLSNGYGPLLSFGISLGLLLQVVVAGLLYLDLLPNPFDLWERENPHNPDSWGGLYWMPITMIASTLFGAALSYRRFPKRVNISPNGIRVTHRGTQSETRYGFENVSHVRYGAESKFLTIWFTDGKAYMFRIAPADTIGLRHYFQMTR